MRPPWVTHSTADADSGGAGGAAAAAAAAAAEGLGSRVERLAMEEDSYPTLLSDLPNVR